jgi:hypothetical protein
MFRKILKATLLLTGSFAFAFSFVWALRIAAGIIALKKYQFPIFRDELGLPYILVHRDILDPLGTLLLARVSACATLGIILLLIFWRRVRPRYSVVYMTTIMLLLLSGFDLSRGLLLYKIQWNVKSFLRTYGFYFKMAEECAIAAGITIGFVLILLALVSIIRFSPAFCIDRTTNWSNRFIILCAGLGPYHIWIFAAYSINQPSLWIVWLAYTLSILFLAALAITIGLLSTKRTETEEARWKTVIVTDAVGLAAFSALMLWPLS